MKTQKLKKGDSANLDGSARAAKEHAALLRRTWKKMSGNLVIYDGIPSDYTYKKHQSAPCS
jgi:hypothetical protein